jgi:hypothetical protein
VLRVIVEQHSRLWEELANSHTKFGFLAETVFDQSLVLPVAIGKEVVDFVAIALVVIMS